MRSQHMRRAIVALGTVHVKRVHLGPRGVVAGNIQRVKVVPVGLDPRPFGHRKSQFGKDRSQFLGRLADRMDRTLTTRAGWQGNVQPFGAQTLVQRGIGQSGLFGGKRRVDLILQRVQRGAGNLAFLGRHFTQLAHLERDLALFAHGSDADRLKRVFVARLGDLTQIFCL